MYIPSGFLKGLLDSEKQAIFCESTPNGHKAIIAKLPTTVIKAILLGVKVDFSIYLSRSKPYYLALCLKIFDSKDSPYHAFISQRWKPDNRNRFDSSYLDCDLSLVVYDDTDIPVLLGDVFFRTNFKNRRVKNILDNLDFESCDKFDHMNRFLDSVERFIRQGSDSAISAFQISTELSDLYVPDSIHVNEQGAAQYNVIMDVDGERQEKQLYQSLCLMKDSRTFFSPEVQIGSKKRELTDVLFVTSDFMIAFESKSISYDNGSDTKTYERICSSTLKHARKAIGQLEGVYKTIAKGCPIFDSVSGDGVFFEIERFFGVVVIDEYRESDHWGDFIDKTVALKKDHGICIVVMSISELIYNLKLSVSDPSYFVKLLEKRYELSLKENGYNIEFIDMTLPMK